MLEQKLQRLEGELEKNEKVISQIRSQIYKLVGNGAPPGRDTVTSIEQIKYAQLYSMNITLTCDYMRD